MKPAFSVGAYLKMVVAWVPEPSKLYEIKRKIKREKKSFSPIFLFFIVILKGLLPRVGGWPILQRSNLV